MVLQNVIYGILRPVCVVFSLLEKYLVIYVNYNSSKIGLTHQQINLISFIIQGAEKLCI